MIPQNSHMRVRGRSASKTLWEPSALLGFLAENARNDNLEARATSGYEKILSRSKNLEPPKVVVRQTETPDRN
jgi:hypothetical protein